MVDAIVAVAEMASAIHPHDWLVDCGAASMAAIPPAMLAIAMAIVPATLAAGFSIDIIAWPSALKACAAPWAFLCTVDNPLALVAISAILLVSSSETSRCISKGLLLSCSCIC